MANKRLPRLLTIGAAVVAMNGGAAVAAATAPPPLRFVAATGTVTLERYPDGVFLDFPTHVVAGAKPFEIWARRASYADPIVATQGTGPRAERLPAGLVTSFSGFTAFTHVKLVDGNGTVVLERDDDFCPNSTGSRTRPDAPDTSPYPQGCSTNPFTLGSVWGIQAGWSAPTSGNWWESEPVDLPVGTYTATITVNPPYVALFGIPADQASTAVQVIVRPADVGERPRRQAARHAAGTAAQPAAARPAGAGTVPAGPKPDLRSLPAWGIQIGGEEGEAGHDHLAFNATVWTAGRSPLVVDGFRRDENMMDAYQYFYDQQGNQTGYAQVGTMEWDPREGHQHWHFTDFAQYRLLDADQQVAVRSGKESFCLANTDAVDYTIPGANWRPDNTDLHTSCGQQTALSVRQVLEIGSGDTYTQALPGQSFDITDLPNGTYYIEVAANPDGNLYESNQTNNVSHRKVILGGEPGSRTVEVPPHDGISG
jgi:Lysyl oxidase